MDPSSLNLFGLADGDGLAELKQRYYELALLCHPDRGGRAEDMVVVQAQYTHAKRELEAMEQSMVRVQKATDLLERDIGAIPDMRSIFDEAHGDTCSAGPEHSPPLATHYVLDVTSDASGYGSLMQTSEYRQAGGEGIVSMEYAFSAACADGSAEPLEGPSATTTCIVEREADSAVMLHPIDQVPTRESGFGLFTPTPTQLPLTDYVVAHSAGESSCIVRDSADSLAEMHVEQIEDDIKERLAKVE
jgi:hypothetical protein